MRTASRCAEAEGLISGMAYSFSDIQLSRSCEDTLTCAITLEALGSCSSFSSDPTVEKPTFKLKVKHLKTRVARLTTNQYRSTS